MWEFMKPKPKPPKPAPNCVQSIEEWRKYVLAELDCVYKRILEELSVTDPESLSKLSDIIKEYEEIDAHVSNSLEVMRQEIQAFRELLVATDLRYTIDPVYESERKNLKLTLREVK